MPTITKNDLVYNYAWTVIDHDDPKLTGIPDSVLLNRREGYEVLAFINKFSNEHKFPDKKHSLMVEELIHKNLPGEIRSHKNVREWLINNWPG